MLEKLSVQDFQANIKLYLSFTKAAADQLLHLILIPLLKNLIKDDCKP